MSMSYKHIKHKLYLKGGDICRYVCTYINYKQEHVDDVCFKFIINCLGSYPDPKEHKVFSKKY